MEETSTATRIIFAGDEEMESRRARVKAFCSPKVRAFLMQEDMAGILNISKVMILEGFSEEFIDELIKVCGKKGEDLTFDFLHMAALVMGADFVRGAFFGKALTSEEACKTIREDYYNQQMQPFEKIYDNLEEKLRAAKEGEEKVNRQIDTLKLQNEHLEEMYKERLGKEKMKHSFQMQIAKGKADHEKDLLFENMAALKKELALSKQRLQAETKEKEELKAQLEKGNTRKWRRRDKSKQGEEKQPQKETEGSQSKENTDERREFCFQALGNGNFSAEQIDLLLPCMEDEQIPLNVLRILCRPDLPVSNMRGLIRYLKGGEEDETKAGS